MKDGDTLIQELKQAAKRCKDILAVFAVLYEPDSIYWLEYIRGNWN